jgi:hypothetical protein
MKIYWIKYLFRRKSPRQLFTERPNRRFRIPDEKDLKKIYPILSSMQFEIVEQKLSSDSFHLVAFFEKGAHLSASHFEDFQVIQISIQGVKSHDRHWQITLNFDTPQPLKAELSRQADLVLEKVTLALGWQPYWIIDCPSVPKNVVKMW